ncbi:protein Smaug isoform X2 [Teleopsis dalmanni]|uniref:protein Smaug isoform X2 n=1 Tax=Teleopsis dalmanni TaxID=139649 RepID=UPI0018CE9F73|nr:protein Smaug isoform X2 [Teleopsis dalmanni]
MKYSVSEQASSCAKLDINSNKTGSMSSLLFCDQVNAVTNLFDQWNECERSVVMYALLKRLRYPSLKFIQYCIESNLTQNLGSQSNLSTVVVDINANNPSYLQNILNAYKTFHLTDIVDTMSSSSSDKDSVSCYGSDFQLTNCDERKLYGKKEDILHDIINMLPLLKPGNDEAKSIYLALVPIAVKDTMTQIVPPELVQQIFSYMLIHPAISNEDRKCLNASLRHLEEHLQSKECKDLLLPSQNNSSHENSNVDITAMTTSGSSTSSSCSATSSVCCSSSSNATTTSSKISLGSSSATTSSINRNIDWQTIAPPNKQHHQMHSKSLNDWTVTKPNLACGGSVNSSIADQFCDKLNGITLNELGSSQNSLGLSIKNTLVNSHTESLALVNGVAAAASVSTTQSLFGGNTNPIINIINNNGDDHDTSFSKNGTEILDFEPNSNRNSCGSCSSGNNSLGIHEPSHHLGYASILMNNCDQLELNRWSLDSKLAALKTRRSNSLTTQTLSSSSSSSNSSVITVNDNCSNSTENLAQFANKPRSFSLSIEHQRSTLTNSGSDTRLDDFKPNYIKFQTRNIGMSSIGLWLKSLRLHKYIDLFKNMTYEEMLQITEEYLQNLGVTKGASHKLALCIEKLKERTNNLIKIEVDLSNGHIKLQTAVEELANIVLTPMKPVEAINENLGEENVALHFLKVIDIVCTIVQKDLYVAQDDESLSVIMWILDRSIHNEAFVNHLNQLKDLKFKLSKLKMSIAPKLHHVKNGSGGSLNKARWNGKSRKLDSKNGSNDRINHRKNSNDMLNFSLSCLQPHNHQQQSDFDKYHIGNNNNNNNNNQHQYKSSSYPNFINNNHQQVKHQQQLQQHQKQQQQFQQQILQHSTHFPTLPQQQQLQVSQQHRRSLNNLIVVSGGPQQPQKVVFKPGQGILSVATTTSAENLQMENAMKNQQRKASLNGISNNLSVSSFSTVNVNATSSPENQQAKKQMATVVMENLANFDQHFTLF